METIEQVRKDGDTWVPVAFFSYFVENEVPVLHQMWVSVLGQTRWEKIETRNIEEQTRAYRQCQVFPADTDQPDEDHLDL